jgi:hypothetical protein
MGALRDVLRRWLGISDLAEEFRTERFIGEVVARLNKKQLSGGRHGE